MARNSVPTAKTSKSRWTKPELRRLGSMRDIAGPQGGNRNNGINTDRIPS